MWLLGHVDSRPRRQDRPPNHRGVHRHYGIAQRLDARPPQSARALPVQPSGNPIIHSA